MFPFLKKKNHLRRTYEILLAFYVSSTLSLWHDVSPLSLVTFIAYDTNLLIDVTLRGLVYSCQN
jgi:hypothetical protein